VWTLIAITSIKYVAIAMRFGDDAGASQLMNFPG
jgi:K+ transporter